MLQDDFGLDPATAAWYLSTVSTLAAAGGVLLGWLGQTLGFGRQVRFGWRRSSPPTWAVRWSTP